MCCRTESKAETAKADIVSRSSAKPEKIHIVQLDLADLDNVETFRTRYDAVPGLKNRPIDMLILNAGVMALPTRELTKQGYEAQMGTNVLGHFKFAASMIDLCKAAPKGRVVVVSSMMHLYADTINLKDFNREKSYNPTRVYSESKLADFLLVAKLNRLVAEKKSSNLVAVACHPGYSATNLQQHIGLMGKIGNALFAQSAERGSEPTVLAATDPNAKPNDYAGPYLNVWGPAAWGSKVNKAVWNEKLQDDLWQKCEELTRCNFVGKL